MATGKTNRKHYRLIADEFDLSGDSRNVSSFGVSYAEADVTGWSDGWTNVTFGHPTVMFDGYQAVFNNATGGVYTALSTVEELIVSLPIGIRAAPAVGDPAFMSVLEQASFTVAGDGPVLVSINMPKSINQLAQTNVWGTVLAAGASISATTNGTSVDNGASSANGAYAYLHVTATSSGSWTLKVQDSTDDAAWNDLITFSADGSAVTAEVGNASGTVDRYMRFQATRTAGTTTFWCTAVRL